jgi:hypothetical protein
MLIFSCFILELQVIWSDLNANNPLANKFSSRLIEDCSAGLMSYVDYLCNMHIKIQANMPDKSF